MNLLLLIGTCDIVSTPPAMTASPIPHMICCAASAIVCSPLEQKRLTVCAGTSTGKPARRLAIRATFIPCSASGIAQPMMTSSISLASTAGARSITAPIAAAAISSGRVVRNVPRGALPIAVRAAETITALVIVKCSLLFAD